METIGQQLSLRGYLLQVKVEKATSLQELAALREPTRTRLRARCPREQGAFSPRAKAPRDAEAPESMAGHWRRSGCLLPVACQQPV